MIIALPQTIKDHDHQMLIITESYSKTTHTEQHLLQNGALIFMNSCHSYQVIRRADLLEYPVSKFTVSPALHHCQQCLGCCTLQGKAEVGFGS